jgi:hypothetical protein
MHRGGVVHHQVVAEDVEAVVVESSCVRIHEALAQFAVKDQVAKALAGD